MEALPTDTGRFNSNGNLPFLETVTFLHSFEAWSRLGNPQVMRRVCVYTNVSFADRSRSRSRSRHDGRGVRKRGQLKGAKRDR